MSCLSRGLRRAPVSVFRMKRRESAIARRLAEHKQAATAIQLLLRAPRNITVPDGTSRLHVLVPLTRRKTARAIQRCVPGSWAIFFNCYVRGVCDRDMGVVSRTFAELGWRRGLAQGSREVESDTKETRRGDGTGGNAAREGGRDACGGSGARSVVVRY